MKKNEIEMLVGRFVLTVLGGLILAGVVLGIVYIMAIFTHWIEGNTFRFFTFIGIMLVIIIKISLKEIEKM